MEYQNIDRANQVIKLQDELIKGLKNEIKTQDELIDALRKEVDLLDQMVSNYEKMNENNKKIIRNCQLLHPEDWVKGEANGGKEN